MRTAIVAIFLASSSLAAADPRTDADAHARRGVALYNLGKYDDAVAEFEQAYTLFQSDSLLFNLAQAHRQLDHCDRALEYYRRVMTGDPSPVIRDQVASIVPKLELACNIKKQPPMGPTAPESSAPSAVRTATAVDASAATPESTGATTATTTAATTTPATGPVIAVSASATAGTVISGGTAPVAGVKLGVTTPVAWLRGELGATAAVGMMWRGTADHDATVAQLAATVRYGAAFDWGKLTLGGEVGAAYFSSMDTSSGVVPGIAHGGIWVPLVRGEVGAEHDISRDFALRVAIDLGMCPRTGALLQSIGEVDLLFGLRYQR